jgi:DNA-binding NtrC family response regulator
LLIAEGSMAKILIVDDEKGICEEFRDILLEEGHEVEIAFNGADALRKVEDQKFDLVFLDVLMPRMEGREVFEKIKKISDVPVAIMSGYMPANKEQQVMSLGAVACLRKPLDLERVKSLVKSIKEQKTN